jgi:hypothetical protein
VDASRPDWAVMTKRNRQSSLIYLKEKLFARPNGWEVLNEAERATFCNMKFAKLSVT